MPQLAGAFFTLMDTRRPARRLDGRSASRMAADERRAILLGGLLAATQQRSSMVSLNVPLLALSFDWAARTQDRLLALSGRQGPAQPVRAACLWPQERAERRQPRVGVGGGREQRM